MKKLALWSAIAVPLMMAGCQQSPTETASLKQESRKAAQDVTPKPIQQPKPHLIALDDLIGFKDPRGCHLNDSGFDLMDGLIELPGDGRVLRGKVNVPSRYQPAFGELQFEQRDEDYHAAKLPTTATWHGLRLLYIEEGFSGMDSSYSDLAFSEPFEKVRSTLNGLGFSFDKKGSQGDTPFEAYDSALVAEEGMTVLSCSR